MLPRDPIMKFRASTDYNSKLTNVWSHLQEKKAFMAVEKSILSSHDRGAMIIWAQMREYYHDDTILISSNASRG